MTDSIIPRSEGPVSHSFDPTFYPNDNEKRFHSMLHVLPVMMWLSDAAGVKTLLNTSWRNFTGKTRNQGNGESWKENIYWQDRPHYLATYSGAHRTRKRYRIEYRIRRHDHRYRWILETGVPRFEGREKFVGFVGSAIDVTERKRSTEVEIGQRKFLELVTKGRPLSEILDFLIELVESHSSEGQCAIMLLEAPEGELSVASAPNLPRSFRDKLKNINVERGNGTCAMAVLRKRAVVVSDIATNQLWDNIKNLALEHELMACTSVPIMTEGRVLGTCAMYYCEARRPTRNELKLLRMASHLVAIAIDRHRKDEALKNAEIKYREIFENAVEGIFQSTPRGRFIAANPAMARMLGYESPAELIAEIGNIATDLYVDSKRRGELQHLIGLEGSVARFESEVYRRDRTKIWVCSNVRVVRDENGAALYYEGTLEDITERKRAAEAQRDLLNRVVTAQEEEQRRLSRELHDHMAQSLTALIFGLTTLEAKCISPETENLLSRLQDITRRLSKEIRSLATQLRPPALDDLGLNSTLTNYVSDWSNMSGINLDFHCNGLLNQRLPEAIETTVYRVIQEALTNVLKHAQAKDVSVIVEYRRRKGIKVVVEDDGLGFEADSLVDVPIGDSGLGLLGMRERATLVGGTVTIESNPGAGTTIIVKIPVP